MLDELEPALKVPSPKGCWRLARLLAVRQLFVLANKESLLGYAVGILLAAEETSHAVSLEVTILLRSASAKPSACQLGACVLARCSRRDVHAAPSRDARDASGG